MQYLRICLLSFVSLFIFSCDPCRNLDCVFSDYDGNFRILSATDGKDLLFGPDKIYNSHDIKVYTLKGADTTFFVPRVFKPINIGDDSVLHVTFFPKADTAYLQFNNNDTDTLAISYETTNTRCCGTITQITNFRYNNQNYLPGRERIQEIRK